MPLYKTDSKGNLYQANSSRHDGSGFESLPMPTGGGDVTLGQAYRRAEVQRQRQNSMLRQLLANEDREAEIKRLHQKSLDAQIKALNAKQLFTENHREYQKRLTNEAVNSSLYGVNYTPTGLSGNGLSSNGRMGEDSLTSEEKNIRTAVFQQFEKNPVAVANSSKSQPLMVQTRNIPFKFFLQTPHIPLASVATVQAPSIPLTDYYEQKNFQLSRLVSALKTAQAEKEFVRRQVELQEIEADKVAAAKTETWTNSIYDFRSPVWNYFTRKK